MAIINLFLQRKALSKEIKENFLKKKVLSKKNLNIMDIRNNKEGREVEEKKMGEESKGEGLIIKRRFFRDGLRVNPFKKKR